MRCTPVRCIWMRACCDMRRGLARCTFLLAAWWFTHTVGSLPNVSARQVSIEQDNGTQLPLCVAGAEQAYHATSHVWCRIR